MRNRDRVLGEDGKFVNFQITEAEMAKKKLTDRESFLREQVGKIQSRAMSDLELEGAVEALQMTREEFKYFPELYSKFMKRKRPAVDAPEVKKIIDEKVELKTKVLEEVVEKVKEEKTALVQELGAVKAEVEEVKKTKEELAEELRELKKSQKEGKEEMEAMQARLQNKGEPVRTAKRTNKPDQNAEKVTIA